MLKVLSLTFNSDNFIISLVTYTLKYWFFRNVFFNFSHIEKFVNKYPIFQRRNGTSLQYSCLVNPMDRGPWKAAVHGVAEGQT